MCYEHHGGAFLFVYILLMIIIGQPMISLEIALGQIAKSGPIKLWATICPAFKVFFCISKSNYFPVMKYSYNGSTNLLLPIGPG
jgi:SNF family Na+-dependent transporter